MLAALFAAAVVAQAPGPSPALKALGLGVLRWGDTPGRITAVLVGWEPISAVRQSAALLTPGQRAVISIGGCRWEARFMGARGVLTRVETDLVAGDRSACARLMVSRINAKLGSPRPATSARSIFADRTGHAAGYAEQEPFWDGVGETVSLIEWGAPIASLSLAATASGDEAATVR